jgi:hypothetical protein
VTGDAGRASNEGRGGDSGLLALISLPARKPNSEHRDRADSYDASDDGGDACHPTPASRDGWDVATLGRYCILSFVAH